MTKECREDIDCSLGGFLSLCAQVHPHKVAVLPGYINSDVVENFFCQQRGTTNGLNTNPTIYQYGPSVNSIILGQKTVSRKSNAAFSQAATFHDALGSPPVTAKRRKSLR